jgi:hypothetical protein
MRYARAIAPPRPWKTASLETRVNVTHNTGLGNFST